VYIRQVPPTRVGRRKDLPRASRDQRDARVPGEAYEFVLYRRLRDPALQKRVGGLPPDLVLWREVASGRAGWYVRSLAGTHPCPHLPLMRPPPTRLLAALLVAAAGTAARAADPDPKGVEFFERKVRPVLAEHCYACHSADAKNKLRGGLALDTREGLLKGGDGGPAVVPGDPGKSLLVRSLRHAPGAPEMPPKGKLPAAVIADVEAWVRMGAPDPRTGPGAVVRKGMSLEDGRRFWSFVPPKDTPPPAVKDATWPRTAADRFVLARLEAKGLTSVGDADRRSLIRRVSFDLHGLPPTPEETDAFVTDRDPQAYEKLVDRLLASPRFGERWGRHWLDAARYADSNGRDRNVLWHHAWRYRNYVIDSFNRDAPTTGSSASRSPATSSPPTRPPSATGSASPPGSWRSGRRRSRS